MSDDQTRGLEPRTDGRIGRLPTSPTAPMSISVSASPNWSPGSCPKAGTFTYHTENGLLGMGPAPQPGAEDPELINAGKKQGHSATWRQLLPSCRQFRHDPRRPLSMCACLAQCRSRKPATCANWSTGAPDAIPAVGGAMDLVAGVKTIFVITQHTTRDGKPKLVEQCTYPLTGKGVVSRIYTGPGRHRHHPPKGLPRRKTGAWNNNQ